MQYKWVALSVTAVGTLMSGVDIRIIIVGLPTVARQLGADAEAVIWVSQAYLLASTVGLLLIGRVSDIFGRVKMYNLGFAVFTIGSALASISQSPLQLILSRIVQGTGSSMLVGNSAAILTDAAPPNELGTMLGTNQIAFRVGSVMGLTLSGVIISMASWRALFYINIPIGIFGTLWAHYRLKEVSTLDVEKKIDWLGFFTFTSGLIFVLVSITFLSYGFGSTLPGVRMLVAGLLLIVYFVRRETKSPYPLLDLHLMKIREFALGNIAQFLNALAWFGVVVMLSFYLQVVLNYNPLQAGIALLPLEVTYVLFGPISGKLSDKYGQRLFSTMGLIVTSLGFFVLSQVRYTSSYSEIAVSLLLLGAGNGMFVSPNISSIMGSVPPNRRGIASAFRTTLFNVGGTLSTGLIVLLITSGIPYSVFSTLLQSLTPVSLGTTVQHEFVNGFRFACLVLAIVNTAAILPSFLRGPRKKYSIDEKTLDNGTPRGRTDASLE